MIIVSELQKTLIAEAMKIDQLVLRIKGITGCDEHRCRKFLLSISPSMHDFAFTLLTEGAMLDDVERELADTLNSASWRLNNAARDVLRALVGVPPLKQKISGDELANLLQNSAK